MYTISELNLLSWRAYFPRVGKSEHFILVNLVQDYFQYLLELLEKNVKNKIIVVACPSSMQAGIAVKVFVRENIGKARNPKGKMLAWQEIKA